MRIALEVFRLIGDGYPVVLLFYLLWSYGIIVYWDRHPTRMQPFQLSPRAALCIKCFLCVFVWAYIVQLAILVTDLQSRSDLAVAIDGISLLINAVVFGLLLRKKPVAERDPCLTFHCVWTVPLLFEPSLFAGSVVDITHSAYPLGLYRVVAATCLGLRACCICAAGLLFFQQYLADARNPSTDEERQGLLTSCTKFRSADLTRGSQTAPNDRLQDDTKWLSRLRGWSCLLPLALPDSRASGSTLRILISHRSQWCRITKHIIVMCMICLLGNMVDSLNIPKWPAAEAALGLYTAFLAVSSGAVLGALTQASEIKVNRARECAIQQCLDSLFRGKYRSLAALRAAGLERDASRTLGHVAEVYLEIFPTLFTITVIQLWHFWTFGQIYGVLIAAISTESLYLSMLLPLHMAKKACQHLDYATFDSFGNPNHPREELAFWRFVTRRIAASSLIVCGMLGETMMIISQFEPSTYTPGQVASSVLFWTHLAGVYRRLSRQWTHLATDAKHADQLRNLLNIRSTVENRKGARPLRLTAGKVEFNSVQFSLAALQQPVFDSVSLSMAGGQLFAILGPSGAGKSTVLDLIRRCYDVDSGSVRIDDQDVRDIRIDSLQSRLMFVPQTFAMPQGTVLDYVRSVKPLAAEVEIFQACKEACIHDDVAQFPHGYNTQVGPDGIELSEGQLQRLALAQVFLKQPDLLLLDDPTTSVDATAENRIWHNIGIARLGKTTIVATNRIATARFVDQIVFFECGKVVEQGNHAELIAAGGRYSDLWAEQMQWVSDFRPGIDLYRTAGQDSVAHCTLSHLNATQTNEPPEVSVSTPKSHKREGSKLNPDAPEFTPRDLNRATVNPNSTNPMASPKRQQASTPRRRTITSPRNVNHAREILSNDPGCKSSPEKSQNDPFKEDLIEPTAGVEPKCSSKLPLTMARIAWSNKPWDASDDDNQELEICHQSETLAIQALPDSPRTSKLRIPRPSPRRFESRSASARDSPDSLKTVAREEQECDKDPENHGARRVSAPLVKTKILDLDEAKAADFPTSQKDIEIVSDKACRAELATGAVVPPATPVKASSIARKGLPKAASNPEVQPSMVPNENRRPLLPPTISPRSSSQQRGRGRARGRFSRGRGRGRGRPRASRGSDQAFSEESRATDK